MWNVPDGPTEPSTAEAERLLEDAAPPRAEPGYDPSTSTGCASRPVRGVSRSPFWTRLRP